MQYKIQHLKLGGVLDQGIAIMKNNFGLLFGILLCTIIPLQLLQGFAQLAMVSNMGIDPVTGEFVGEPVEPGSELVPMVVLFVVATLGFLVAYPLGNAAVIHVVARAYLGKATTLGEALRLGLSSLLGLIWTGLLYIVIFIGGLILLIIPGILFALWFCMYQHVVVIERTTGFAALKRSKAILSTNYGTLIALGLVIAIIGAALGFVSALVPQAHVSLVVTVLVQSIATILGTACAVVFYFSCRCKNENFDLQFLAESVGIQAETAVLGEEEFDTPEE